MASDPTEPLLYRRIDGRVTAFREDCGAGNALLRVDGDAKGWAALSWGKEWGGPGWTAIQKMIFLEENQMAPAPELSAAISRQ